MDITQQADAFISKLKELAGYHMDPAGYGGINDGIHIDSNVRLVLTGPDGYIKQIEEVHNLIVTVGKGGVAECLLASPSSPGKPTHMAIGTGTNAAAAGDTALQTELDRNALATKTRSTNVLTMTATWAAGDGTGAITEAGVFDASSSGNLYSRAQFSVINKGSLDTLDITWTYTFG